MREDHAQPLGDRRKVKVVGDNVELVVEPHKPVLTGGQSGHDPLVARVTLPQTAMVLPASCAVTSLAGMHVGLGAGDDLGAESGCVGKGRGVATATIEGDVTGTGCVTITGAAIGARPQATSAAPKTMRQELDPAADLHCSFCPSLPCHPGSISCHRLSTACRCSQIEPRLSVHWKEPTHMVSASFPAFLACSSNSPHIGS